jgi:hypothetical protein
VTGEESVGDRRYLVHLQIYSMLSVNGEHTLTASSDRRYLLHLQIFLVYEALSY